MNFAVPYIDKSGLRDVNTYEDCIIDARVVRPRKKTELTRNYINN